MIGYKWDPAKNALNKRLHGISFEEASKIFEHETLGWPDERFDYGEERWIAIGVAGEKEIVVTYIEQEDHRRIVSARETTRRERALYWRTIGR